MLPWDFSAHEAQDQVDRALLADVVVDDTVAVLALLTRKDQAHGVSWDLLLVLDGKMYEFDGLVRLDIQGDGLAGEGLDENLKGIRRC